MKLTMRVVLIFLWLLGIWCVGEFTEPVEIVAQGVPCPNVDVSCPSNCNYARGPYGQPYDACTEVTHQGIIYCCLYQCQDYRCRRRGMPETDWCGLSRTCRLESATENRCVYLSGYGWACKSR
jgi:hypothetical protein